MATASAARARLVALGASNLTRGLGHLLATARQQAGGPVEVVAALGFGRWYCLQSRLFARELPGIDGCGLWDALAAAPPLPATGLLMDVGNDLLYEVEVPAILGQVGRALQQLRPRVDRLVLSALPMQSLRRLGRWRYTLFRSLLFPHCRIPLAPMLQQAERLDHGLRDLAARHGAVLVQPQLHWYGLDPVHIRWRWWPQAGTALLRAEALPRRQDRPSWAQRWRLLRARPALRWRHGREQRWPQPALRLADGSTVSLY